MKKMFSVVALFAAAAPALLAHPGHSQTEVGHVLEHLFSLDHIAILAVVALFAVVVLRNGKASDRR
jgi:hypothetical protein